MREIRCAVVDLDHYLQEGARAKHQLDAEHWRDVLRPCAMRLFASRTAKLELVNVILARASSIGGRMEKSVSWLPSSS